MLFMPFPLEGKKVRLRALEQRDLEPIWEAYKDLELELITSGDSPPVSDRQVQAFWSRRIDDPPPENRYFVIEPLPGQSFAGQFAGMINLYEVDMRNRHAELAIWMASKDMRGLGFGTDAIKTMLPYAFEVVRLDKVHLGVYDFNEGGMRSYERAGFRYEGRLRQMIYYKERYWDEWPMRILRSEWDLIRRPPQDGVHPFHPNEFGDAVRLIREELHQESENAAYLLLRGWRRRFDCEVYSVRHEGRLIGLALPGGADADPTDVQRIVCRTADRDAARALIAAAGFSLADSR
jgi:RimJ/RimL family protein N-acetyltransferase